MSHRLESQTYARFNLLLLIILGIDTCDLLINCIKIIQVFYCIDWIIYQSPCLLDLLRVRIAQISLNLFSCFEELQSRIRYNSSNEHTLSLEKRKRVKRNREQCDGGDDSGEHKKEEYSTEDDEQDRDDNGIVINNDDMEISGDVHKEDREQHK